MDFEDLEVWKRARKLSVEIYRELANLKDLGFRDQITRSGLSVPSNIAEGFESGMDIEYISRETGNRWIQEATAVSSMLGGLIRTKRGFVGK